MAPIFFENIERRVQSRIRSRKCTSILSSEIFLSKNWYRYTLQYLIIIYTIQQQKIHFSIKFIFSNSYQNQLTKWVELTLFKIILILGEIYSCVLTIKKLLFVMQLLCVLIFLCFNLFWKIVSKHRRTSELIFFKEHHIYWFRYGTIYVSCVSLIWQQSAFE